MRAWIIGLLLAIETALVLRLIYNLLADASDVVPEGRAWLARRRARLAKERADHLIAQLRDQVRAVSVERGIDLPWSRDYEWRGPGVKIILRSGVEQFYINTYEHGIGQYEHAIRAELVPRDRTFQTQPPKDVEHWSELELEEWLAAQTLH